MDSRQPFPGTAVGFPHLAQSRQAVGGKPTPTPEHVAALITVQHRPWLRKTTKRGYTAVCFYATIACRCGALFSTALKNVLNY